MPPRSFGVRRLRTTASVVLLVLPMVLFYLLLWDASCGLPYLDDYPAVLGFLNAHVQIPSMRYRIAHVLLTQHNDYRLVFEQMVFVAERDAFGHVDFPLLIALGNGFVLLLFLLLWKAAFRDVPPARRTLLMCPAAFLLFQLQYASTLDWAMGALQNLPVLFFVLLSLLLLEREGSAYFVAAVGALILAVASSGNGFLGALAGMMLLLARRQLRRLFAWALITVLAYAAYFYHYDYQLSPTTQPHGRAVVELLRPATALYALSFLGSSAARTTQVGAAVVLGAGICAVLGWMVARRYDRVNPALFYFLIFLTLTAASVAVLRGGSGLEQSLASRYRIYSNLALMLAYIAITERLLRTGGQERVMRVVLPAALVGSALFCVASDIAGYRFLKLRGEQIRRGVAEYEDPRKAAGVSKLSTGVDAVIARHQAAGLYRPIPGVLADSERLGVYRLPAIH